MSLQNNYTLGLFLCFLLFLSCQDDDENDPTNEYVNNCLIQAAIDTPEVTRNYRCYYPLNASFCDTMVFDNVIPLTNDQKLWVPNYCLDSDTKRTFRNKNGITDFAEMTSSSYRQSASITSREGCADTNKRILYCGLSERVTIEWNLNPLERSVRVDLSGKTSWDSLEQWSAGINITSNRDSFINHGSFTILENGYVENYRYRVFHDTLTLDGEWFNDVVEFLPGFMQPEKNRFFYSKHYGIVSFTDDDGEQWVHVKED